MKIRVSVNGAKGRLGQLACRALQADPQFELVGELTRGDDLGAHCRTITPDVILNVVPASAVFATTKTILEHGVRVVVGASGLISADIDELQKLCDQKKCGAIIASNFSIGACLMMLFAEQAARYFSAAEVIEYHHDQKQDAPSGTSLRTAELIARAGARGGSNRHEILPGARGAAHKGVSVHALRLPGLSAHQEVLFASPSEMLTIRHDVHNREAYVPGILLSCHCVLMLETLVVGLESLLLDNR